MQSYTVPAGVSSLTIEAWGAEGGGGIGGKGARMKGDFDLTLGMCLRLW